MQLARPVALIVAGGHRSPRGLAHRFELSVIAGGACGPSRRRRTSRLRDELIDGIADCDGLDGVFLSSHGAMIAEGSMDLDGDIARLLRERIGGVPIVLVLDMRATSPSKSSMPST